MNKQLRKTVLGATALTVGVTGVTVAPPAANADAKYGCAYPYVCVYGDPFFGTVLYRYRQITDQYQNIPNGGVTVFSVYNTRNDDTVVLRLGDGSTKCVRANSGDSSWAKVTGLMIRDQSWCSNMGG